MSRVTTYATIGEIREGSIIRLDGGFTCIGEGETRVVKRGDGGLLYFDCRKGHHYLAGQSTGGEYIGVTLVPAGDGQ